MKTQCAMTMKEAFSIASNAVGKPRKYPMQHGYTWIEPYYPNKPKGPTYERRASNKHEAYKEQRYSKAIIALYLLLDLNDKQWQTMTWEQDSLESVIEYKDMTWRDAVRYVLNNRANAEG